MKRRTLLAVLSLAPWVPAIAAAPVGSDLKPYREVPRVAKYASARRNLAFVSFDCPVCRQFFAPIAKWGATLPKPWSMDIVPVITSDLGMVAAHRAWRTVVAMPNANTFAFADALFTAVQDRGLRLDNPRTYATALVSSGIDVQAFGAAFKQQNDQLAEIVQAMQAFQIDAVPALAIAGRYVITPDSTNGNQDQFMTLASALQSGVMRGML